jgi:hypothetical protein
MIWNSEEFYGILLLNLIILKKKILKKKFVYIIIKCLLYLIL